MSQIDAQFVDEHSSFNGGTLSTLMSTPRYMLGDNTYRAPTMTILGASMKLDDNTVTHSGYPRTPNAYHPCTQKSNLEAEKDGNGNCWTPFPNAETYPTVPGETQGNGSIISWAPVLPTHTLIQHSASPNESVNKYVVLTNSGAANTISNYTLIPPSRQTPQTFWHTVDNMNYTIPKDGSIAVAYSTDLNVPHRVGNSDLVSNGFNHMNQVLLSQCQNGCLNDTNNGNSELQQFPKYWLLTNFERVDDESTIARSIMYNYYVYACHERGDVPMNSAGLGKVIRSVFGAIKNRRLGARGDSRYHYMGVKVKENSQLLCIPPARINAVSAMYTKTIKNTFKGGRSGDSRSCDSSNDAHELMSPSSGDVSRISQELKILEDLERKPLSTFREHLEGVCKFNISVKWENRETANLDEEADRRYTAIFSELNAIFTELGRRIIVCFRDQDETALTNAIKSFWLTEKVVYTCIDSESQERVEFRLPFCLNEDENIKKYVNCYDCAFLQLLVDKTVNQVLEKVSNAYLSRVKYLLTVMRHALAEGLVNYSGDFIALKLDSIKKAIDVVNDAKEIHLFRIRLLQSLRVEHSGVLKLYTVCMDCTFNKLVDNFHLKYNFIFRDFVTKIEVLEEFFVRLAVAPLHSSSQGWFDIVDTVYHKVISDFAGEDSSATFIQEWCIYQSLLNEFLVNLDGELNQNLFLACFSIKILTFRAITSLIKERSTYQDYTFQEIPLEFV